MLVQAKNFTPASRERVDLIVLHSMESQELVKTAENVASWFAGPNAPRASAHFCIDADSAIQCVKIKDVAWHAPGANHNGIGLEHAGRASQTREQWLDEYGREMLELSARLCAHLCRRYNIPAIYRNAGDLRLGVIENSMRVPARGITRHVDATVAFRKSSHTDPGEGFPLHDYVKRVALLLTEPDPLAPRRAIDVPV